jgi:hypothetical protein
MADFASAFLTRHQSTATDFEREQIVVTGLGRFGHHTLPTAPSLHQDVLKARARSGIAVRLDRAASARGI